MRKQLLATLVMLMALVIHAEVSDWYLTKVYYDINGRTWKISLSGDHLKVESVSPLSGDVIIPDAVPVELRRYNYSTSESQDKTVTLPVKELYSYLFRDNSQIVSVTIPDGVTSGVSFLGCGSLASVNIGNGVTSIGESAFKGCSSLTSITIPDSVTSIGRYAFYGCSSLASVNIRNGVSSIGENAFYYCSSLASVTIPDSVTSIGGYAFSGCSSLTSATIGNGVKSIGNRAFEDCSSLTSASIGNGVTHIGNYAFYGCRALASVTIPNSVTSIGELAFRDCSSIASVAIPDSVTSIGWGVFGGCSSLTSATIGNGVASIVISMFSGCRSLVSVTIPNSVTSIGDSAFNNCSSLTSITIPDSVTSIGASAFYGCSNIGCIDVGAGVTSIGEKCFCSCMNLTNIVFHGNAPTTVGGLVLSETSLDMNIVVQKNSTGWTEANGNLPARWPYNTETGRYIRYAGDEPISSERIVEVHLSVTNIVVNYVFNSVQPEFAVPMSTTDGFVNIIAQVHGGASGIVAVPDSWPGNYSAYHQKFGSDFTQSLTKKTGKKDGAGNEMFVWQDFVAGTDPTDENDVFTASITTDTNGKLLISYTPELSDDEKAKRIYKTLGKTKLTDADWTEIPAGHEADYNFFKVTVEMK